MISEVRTVTLSGLLRSRAAERPQREAFLFLTDGEQEGARLTYAELDRRARAIALALRQFLAPGERALLLYQPGLEFIAAFFGCLYAGVIAVPAYPPRPNDRSQSRLRSIVRDAGPGAALTTSSIFASALDGGLAAQLPGLRWIATDELGGVEADLPEPSPDSVAFLQYTSGSTAAPKGVMVTHANLLHNERMIGEAFQQDEDSVVVGWLPLYHDMGLIGNVLQPIHAGARCVLMSPVAFLQKPLRWLEAIHRYRGTTSGGPNFAYELCVRRIGPEERERLDLSSWRVAFNGAEPVRARTLERFAEAFAVSGFRHEAFYPCYGLAEATLFVSGGLAGRLPQVESAESGRPLVSCGRAWGGQRIAVADPETGEEVPPGREGEIWIAGESVAAGYWGNPEATERDFQARLATGEGPFLRTGDLGILRGGELYVTGRLKDLIILRGRNHYPQDIELTAEQSHPDLRPGSGAAFSVEVAGEERLVVVQEVERHRRQGFEELTEAVRRAVAEEHEVQVHEVVLARVGAVPKTSSGKVQRRLCRERYLAGELAVLGRSALAGEPAGSPAVLPTREALLALEPAERREALERSLRERAAAALGAAAEAIDPGRPLISFGLDSLAALELKGSVEAALGMELPLSELLEGAGTGRLADLLLAGLAEAPEAPPAVVAAGEDHGRLSFGQRAIWFLERLAPGGGAYNIAVAARVRGDLDAGALRRALQALVDRHAALRTVFQMEGDEPVRRVLDRVEIDFLEEEWSEERLAQEAYGPFSLEHGPLLRVRLLGSVLLLSVHHIVTDFASLAILARELGALYRQEANGGAAGLPPLSADYTGFVRWQEGLLDGPRGERLWSYWREALAGLSDLDLPADRPRPPAQTWRGVARALELPPSLADGVRELGASRGATLFMTVLAAFQAQLGRYSGQSDFAVGSPTAGRSAPEHAGIVGYFVSPVALRADLSGDPSVSELLDRVRRTALAGLEHADFPFALLAERLRPERDPARAPIFQTLLVLQRLRPGDPPGLAAFALGEEGGRIDLGGLELESLRLEQRRAQLDLTLRAAELPSGGLGLSLEANADLFDAATAERMLGHLRTLLEGAVADPVLPVSALPLLTSAERRQILVDWNATGTAAVSGLLLHQRFEEQAARTPGAEALVAGSERLTYGELNRRANRLARHLRSLGVGPEVRVGVRLGRSADLVVALLAVLKAGGAYVPLDPSYPKERLDLMVEDSGAEVVIESPSQGEGFDDSNLDPVALPGNLAYLIYTSGSTGRPKAVAIEHRSAVAFLHWAGGVFTREELSGVLASTSVAFDLSVFELFVPLSWGGRVILAENVLALPTLEAASEVTLVNTVPSAMAELVRGNALPPSVRTVNLAGEPVPPALVDAVCGVPGIERLYNLYGPSEDTTYSTFALLKAGRGVTIGRPIEGTRAYLLDRGGEPAPAGVPGELYLAGEGLARGYLGRPELTAERFVPDSFGNEPGARLYRTGDLARWLADGAIDFLGRADHQVKVRGFRVELGEIEAALCRHPGVRDAVVAAREEGEADKRLVAYVVAEEGAGLDVAALRNWLRERLPDAFVPAGWVALPALPLSPNGKVDRGALARIAPKAGRPDSLIAEPRTPAEQALAGIWREVLGRERVGIHDDFFELGGHSLLAARVAFRITEALGIELPLSALFQNRTIAALAERLEAAGATPGLEAIPAASATGPFPLSFAQQRLWLIDRREPGTAAYNISGERLAGDLSVPRLARSLGEIVRRHEPLRTVYAEAKGQPVQIVLPPVAPPLPMVDLGGLPAPQREPALRALLSAQAGLPFDLERGPVARFVLARLGAAEHALIAMFHHIAADRWSVEVFFRELAALYVAAPLPEPPIRYVDYVSLQRRLLESGALDDGIAYWERRLAGAPVLELPLDRPRSKSRSLRGLIYPFDLPPGLTDGLRAVASAEGVPLFPILLAGFFALLSRYSDQEDLCVGVPVAGRDRPETREMIGLFANPLVLRTGLEDGASFRELARRVGDALLAGQEHQDVPFEKLVEVLRPERSASSPPLFQALFSFLSASGEPVEMPGLRLEPMAAEPEPARLDLACSVHERAGRLHGWLELPAALFEASTGARLRDHFLALLRSAAAEPGLGIRGLGLLGEAERHQLLVEWNDAFADGRQGPTAAHLFAARAGRTPDATALIGGGQSWTYRELSRWSDQVARRLRRLGVGREDRVGLLMDRSAAMVAGILGVWKAGAAFVPLDPSLPEERLAWMARDAGLAALVASQERRPDWGVPAVDPGDEVEAGETILPELEDLAYLIYTSGTTGRPKAVMVEHRNLAQTLLGCQERFGFGAGDLMPHLASFSFDISLFELFMPLLAGGAVELLTRGEILDVSGLTRRLARATRVHGVPGLMRQIVEALRQHGEACAGLRTVFVGGESVPPDLLEELRRAFPGAEIVVLYGPTEASIVCAALSVPPHGLRWTALGRPLPGVDLRLLDRRGRPVPIGVAGELHVGGLGVTRGYHRRPDLTAERYLPSPGGRLCRTGDLARYLPDGVIEFLGRADQQVKVRGFRVEPGEVEVALRACPGVREAVVAAPRRSGEATLAAYVVPEDEACLDLDGEARHALFEGLRATLASRLPDYMIPSAWTALAALPLSPNGKVDRRALPYPEVSATRNLAAPRTPAEERLAAIWREVLGVASVGIHDDFFELGGHSLLAVRLTFRIAEALGFEVPVSVLFQRPTVAGLARWLEEGAARPAGDLAGSAVPAQAEAFPLSPAQRRLWLVYQMDPSAPSYNLGVAVRMVGDLQEGPLAWSLGEILRRHEPLRTVYGHAAGEPFQAVLPPPADPPLVRLDLSVLPAEDREPALREAVRTEMETPFHLERGLMVRFILVRLGAGEHALLATFHHIASDGWSMELFFHELAALYQAAASGLPSPLPELPLRYVDYSLWQRQALTAERIEEELGWWRRQLSGVPVLALPTDRPRPARPGRRAGRGLLSLPLDLVEGLRGLGRGQGITLFMSLLAGFIALLSRYTGQADFAVGTPAAGRGRRETEALIGFFVNTLVLRAFPEGGLSFHELLRQVRELALAAQEHQDLPFDVLVEQLQPERDPSVTPFFQVMFAFFGSTRKPARMPGLEMSLLDPEVTTAKFDLTLWMHAGYEREEGAGGFLEYRAELFEAATMDRLLGHYRTLLEGVAAQPALPLSALPLLTPAERRQLLVDWNATAAGHPRGLLHQRFEAQAARDPGAEALIAGAERLSYGELNRRANRLARHLRTLGVGPEVRVGVSLRRSADMVVALLAVLKAGGAYVPLDPSYPQERLALMLEDSRATVMISSERAQPAALLRAAERLSVVDLDRDRAAIEAREGSDPDAVATPENLAYLIYTSGSTGRPKAVAIEHRSATVFVGWARGVFTPEELSGVLASTSIGFDLSVFELFVPLSWGGRVVLVENALALPGLQAASEVTLVNTVPSAMAELVRGGGVPASVRTVNLAGEPIPPPLVGAVCALPGVERLYNLYGPSEDTTYSTFALLAAGRGVTIGRPIDDTRAYVLDSEMEPVPVGVAGELHLAGEGLARGYLGRPELTAARFLPDPFAAEPGGRLYRTGDLVRWRPAGEIDFVGRIDHQVKVRGFRIELGEIEAALARHAGIREAVVLAPGEREGGRRLVAYLVPREPGGPPAAELRDFLRRTLPEFMIPSAFVTLEALPLSPNGKVDRKALAEIEPEIGAPERVAPRTPLEETLARLWTDVLGEERTRGGVGVHDNFFDLGGHSLLASRLSSQIRSVFGVDLPLRELFEAPTVAQLAARLERESDLGEQALAIPRLPRTPGETARFPVSFSQLREWILDRLEPGTPAYNIPGPMRIAGPLSIPALERTVREIVRRHESLRTVFEAGPEEPLQAVAPPAAAEGFSLPVIDLEGLPGSLREPEMRRLLLEDLRLGFDLAAGPLLRLRIVRLASEDHAVLFTIHHIVSDGWSMGVFSRELGVLYDAFSHGRPSPLPELPVQYPDFAAWQRQRFQGELLERQIGYWRSRIDGAAPVLDLPADRPRPAVRSSRGAMYRTFWPEALVAPLRALAVQSGASLFMVLLAGYQGLLARLSGQEDVPVGTFAGNRGRTELEGLIGFFINTLVLRTDLSGDPAFRELVDRVREVTLGAYAHQEIPFEKLLESLDVPRDPSRTPLFQTMLVLQNFPREKVELSRVTLEPLAFETRRSNFDLTLWMMEERGGIAFEVTYSTDLFEEATVARVMGYLRNLVEAAAADPGARLRSLPLLPAAERAQILDGWSRTAGEPAGAPLLHRLFEEQAARSPWAAAVETGAGARLTYAELDTRADRLARYLRRLGVGPESRVALAVERSPEMLVGMLGVLKAGGAYVPLDPAYPQDRLAYMLEDSGATLLLTQERLAGRIPTGNARVILLDVGEPPVLDDVLEPAEIHPEAAAYVIYTSGSMGRPKGVVVAHRSIAAYARTAREYYAVTPADRVLQFGSISFDTSAEEIYPTLIAGATLVLRSDDMALSMSHFLGETERLGITVLALQTAFWHEIVAGLIDGLALPFSLRLVAIGGEAALADRVAAWRRRVEPGVRLVNTYGPTEATIVSTYRELAQPGDDPEVPIGRAIPGARTYVLDRRFEPVPAGVGGELMVGGAGVARGYLGRPDLTADRFVPDPYSGVPGARLYRTGDLARFRPDGDLLFCGRADRQLKLRGYRIEPGEVEAALRQHPALHDAVVDLRGREDDKRLMAWVVPREGQIAPSAPELRAFLRERLPEPMVPSAFLPVAALPLTPGGKVDRRALPEPEAARAELPGYVEPETVLERTIAGIFRDLLRVDRVGLNDNFFELGGHSLLVVRAHQRLREALGREIPVVDLFRFPTVALLARYLGGGPEEKPAFQRVQDLAERQKAAQSAQLRRKQAMEKMRRPGSGPARK